MSSNRMAALALAALMACMPMEAFAEATLSEAEATQTPDAAETPENTETPEETPTPAPDQGPELKHGFGKGIPPAGILPSSRGRRDHWEADP